MSLHLNHQTSSSTWWSSTLIGVVASTSAVVATTLLFQRYVWRLDKADRDKRLEAAKSLVGASIKMVPTSDQGNVKMLTSFSKGSTTNRKFTVVLIHGFGCTSMEWHHVAKGLAERGLDVFNHDRILFVEGADNLPCRDSTVLVQELHYMLRTRGIQPPYLLLGHSYGGLLAQEFARTFPKDIAGMVLVDPAHPDQYDKLPTDFAMGLRDVFPYVAKLYQNLAWTGLLKLLDHVGLFNFPPIFFFAKHSKIRTALADLYSNGQVWKTVALELEGCAMTFSNLKKKRHQGQLKPLPQVPIALLIATDRRHSPTLFPKQVTQAFLQMHQDFPGKLYLADKSDHWIHLQQPESVLQAVDNVASQIVPIGGAQ